MPAASGDRFSGQNLSDCAFCPPADRQFRTQRQCSGCAKPLCLVCRPEVPGTPYRCPECGGGAVEDTLHTPDAAVRRIQEAGAKPPFWLTLLVEHTAASRMAAEEVIVPE